MAVPSLTARVMRRFRRWAEDRRGATAVEFAFVAFPFFLMLFAILEVTFMFFVATTLENATMEAARSIRTGDAAVRASQASFQTAVCDNLSVLVPCDGRLHVDVRTYTNFNDYASTNPVTDGDFDPDQTGADFGASGEIVVAKAYYIWDVFTPSLGTGLANLNGNKRLIVASAAFRNEPFGT